MKKYIKYFIITVIAVLQHNISYAQSPQKEVIIFSQPCHFCDLLKNDLNDSIIADNPDINFIIFDITQEENRKKLLKYAKKHGLAGGQIGLPLIFAGDNYIMGWGENGKKELEEYMEILRSENLTRLPVESSK